LTRRFPVQPTGVIRVAGWTPQVSGSRRWWSCSTRRWSKSRCR